MVLRLGNAQSEIQGSNRARLPDDGFIKPDLARIFERELRWIADPPELIGRKSVAHTEVRGLRHIESLQQGPRRSGKEVGRSSHLPIASASFEYFLASASLNRSTPVAESWIEQSRE
jgi:hypothetical protein